jgi:hypothetical protein
MAKRRDLQGIENVIHSFFDVLLGKQAEQPFSQSGSSRDTRLLTGSPLPVSFWTRRCASETNGHDAYEDPYAIWISTTTETFISACTARRTVMYRSETVLTREWLDVRPAVSGKDLIGAIGSRQNATGGNVSLY